MPKYVHTDKLQDNLIIPVKLSEQIIEGTLSYTIQFLIDHKIDISPFEKKIHNDETGRPAYNPRIFLKLILFAYANGLNSSRRIAAFARENVVAMALAENTQPDFTSIANFIATMDEEVNSVFLSILLIAQELDLLGNTAFALDGLKLPSNASKEKSGTFKSLRKKQEKFKAKIDYLLKTHKFLDETAAAGSTDNVRKKSLEKLEKKIVEIEKFLATNQPRLGGKKHQESQSNITDNESAKMKTGHGVIQGYNGQALVDSKHQLIIAAHAFGKGQDHNLLAPMLDTAINNFKALGKDASILEGKQLLADTGYFSEGSLAAAALSKMDAFIPDNKFRKRDPRFETKDRHVPGREQKILHADFRYEEEQDVVICPEGRELKPSKAKPREVNKIIYKRYHGKETVCRECPRKASCLGSAKTRYRLFHIAVGEQADSRELIKSMMEKIDTPAARQIYSKRMGIVEPVFANIRIHKGLDRFTLRGERKVNIQWLLYCILHNISKIQLFGNLMLL